MTVDSCACRRSVVRLLLAAFLLFVIAQTNAAELPASSPIVVDWRTLQAVNKEPLPESNQGWTVVCFLGSECPLARLYGDRLNRLAEEFAPKQVRFVGVNSNPQDSPKDIQQYVEKYGIKFPIVKDADQAIAEQFQATRTPEVFVLDASSRIRYRGRIDDQYEPGIARAQPNRHELREAIEALSSGREAPFAKTAAVGCLITKIAREPQSQGAPTLTFARDVAPILNRRCVECHRQGEIGPFALTDYSEVIGWGQMLLEVIDQGRMPPWHADPAHGKFLGERRIPAEERAILADWVRQGMPAGDLASVPAQPNWGSGWHLSTAPDLELVMRDRPFQVPNEGTVDYQYFVVDPKWTEDRWVSAAQVIPGDAAVVHHAIVFVRPPDGAESHGIGWLGAYVPGQRTVLLPPGNARRVPAGSKLVFQMHYTPNGRATEDKTRVGIWFSDENEVTHQVFTRVALNHNFEIPPGEKDHKVRMRLEGFSDQSRLLGLTPHMHLRGKSFRIEACRGEDRETLLSVPRYDFNWQHWYQFESSLDLAAIDALDLEVHFDNSSSNPVNPAPDEYVTWGDQTWNEMAVAFLDISHPRGAPIDADRDEARESKEDRENRLAKSGSESTAGKRANEINQRVQKFLAKMDGNRDGVVERDETPITFQRFGFGRMDVNGDGRLDRGEIESAAEQRS